MSAPHHTASTQYLDLAAEYTGYMYALNYEVLQLPGGAAAALTEPSVSLLQNTFFEADEPSAPGTTADRTPRPM